MKFILPEILIIVTLFAFLFVNIEDYFFYSCYSIFQHPSCFPKEYYIVSTAFIIFIAIFFVKLLYIIKMRREFISQKQSDFLEYEKEEMEKDIGINSGETPSSNIFELIKEALTPNSLWGWKYNSKKHFLIRFIILLVIFLGIMAGIIFS